MHKLEVLSLALVASTVFAACSGDDSDGKPSPQPTRYALGGTVSGLLGSGLVLQLNGGQDLAVTADGSFAFPPQVNGSSYVVSVSAQPVTPHQTCTVTNGTGSVAGAAISDIGVTCVTDTFTVGVNVVGLAGTGLVLQNNGGDDLPVSANGDHSFATAIASGATYAVTISGQPTGLSQTCAVTAGSASGTVGGANVTGLVVTCVTDSFDLAVKVTGLLGDNVQVNDGAETLTLAVDESTQTFAAKVVDGTAYAVTITKHPGSPDQACVPDSPTGTMAGQNALVVLTCGSGMPIADTSAIGSSVANGGILDAGASVDPYGVGLTYAWEELTATGVTIENLDASDPTGTTISNDSWPVGNVALLVTLRLTVTNSAGSDTDDIDVFLYRDDVRYVAVGGVGDGATPETPSGDVRVAIAAADAGGDVAVVVAEGTYLVNSNPNDDLDISDAEWIEMAPDVSLFGGFEATTWQRDIYSHVTVLRDEATQTDTGSDNTTWTIHATATPTATTYIDGFVIEAAVLEVAPLYNAGAVRLGGSEHWVVSRNVVTGGSEGYGVYCNPCRSRIIRNDIDAKVGVTLFGNSGGVAYVESNIISSGNRGIEILWTGANPVLIANNLLLNENSGVSYGIVGVGSSPSGAPTNVAIVNNIFAGGPYTFNTCIQELHSQVDIGTIQNNDFAACTTVLADGQGGCTAGSCSVSDLNGMGEPFAGNVTDAPVFVEPGVRNYRLSGTSAVNIREGGRDGVSAGWSYDGSDFDELERTDLAAGSDNSPSNTNAEGWSMGPFEYDTP